jgi:hypothetical protein
MALEVYLGDDIRRGILAITIAKLNAVSHGTEIPIEYCRGIMETAEELTILYGGTQADFEEYLTGAIPQTVWEAVIL